MKIHKTKTFDSTTELKEFLTFFHDEDFKISFNSKKYQYIVTIDEEVTEPEFNISNLSDIAHDNELTLEQQNAIDYGISAIKTLVDMEVIK